MAKITGFSVTYDIVTPESAEQGDVAESGFVKLDVSLYEAVAAMDGCNCVASCAPFDATYPYTFFSAVDPDVNMFTGAEETRSLHMPRNLTPSTRRRIARLLGVRGV